MLDTLGDIIFIQSLCSTILLYLIVIIIVISVLAYLIIINLAFTDFAQTGNSHYRMRYILTSTLLYILKDVRYLRSDSL